MNASHIASFVGGALSVGAILALAGVPARPDGGSRPHSPRVERVPATVVSTSSELQEPIAEQTFAYDPIVPGDELIEPIPGVEEFFEDFLEIDYYPERVELGRALFHDPRLSTDNTISCASCHDLRYAGIDRAVSATGVRGQIGPINTPTVFNSALNVRQFWDGRADDLEAQADGPPNAPGEMASSWEEITAKLEQDTSIMAMVHDAFPDEDHSQGIDFHLMLSAIADFERTLITPNSPFDRYLQGDEDAIGELAKEGYQVFKDTGCIECHSGMAIGSKSFQKLGRHRPYFDEHTAGVDLGRFNVTGNDDDRYAFKVATLRNVALTAPYFHDGSKETLADAVRAMGALQLDVDLTDAEVERIVAFLETLTGEYEGMPLDTIQNTVENRAVPAH